MITTSLKDGLYQVTSGSICAGFLVEKGKVVWCANILRKKLRYWMKVAVRIGD